MAITTRFWRAVGENLWVGTPLDAAFVTSHRKFAAYPWAVLVDRTQHGFPVQCRAPAIIEPMHALPTPPVSLDEAIGHPGVGDEKHLQEAATRRAVCAGHLGLRMNQSVPFISCVSAAVWAYLLELSYHERSISLCFTTQSLRYKLIKLW